MMFVRIDHLERIDNASTLVRFVWLRDARAGGGIREAIRADACGTGGVRTGERIQKPRYVAHYIGQLGDFPCQFARLLTPR